jgi:hypothetical protein
MGASRGKSLRVQMPQACESVTFSCRLEDATSGTTQQLEATSGNSTETPLSRNGPPKLGNLRFDDEEPERGGALLEQPNLLLTVALLVVLQAFVGWPSYLWRSIADATRATYPV